MRFIAAIIAPIPLFHLWLHGLLDWWRRFPVLLYVWGLVLWLLAATFFVWIIASSQLFLPPAGLKVFGWILISLGFLAALWSILTLGPKRFFVWGVLRPESASRSRVESGPFRFLPHPAYSGYLITAIGVVLASGQMFAVALLVYLLILMPLIMWLEEKELQTRVKG